MAFSYFANAFVPRSGEVARCAALNQTDHIPVDQLFGTVITERVVDFVMLFGLVGFALITNLDAFLSLMNEAQLPATPTLLGLAVFGLAGSVGLWWLAQQRGRDGIVGKAAGFLQGIGTGIRSVLAMEKRAQFLAHTLFIWAMYFLMSYVLFKAIPAVSSLGFTDAVLVMVAGGFGMVLPAPGGIGSYHWAVSLGFAAVGFSSDVGFAVANVVWLTQTAMIVVTGGLGYVMLFLHRMRRLSASNSLHQECIRKCNHGEARLIIVFTNGVFDLLHVGHLAVLETAAAEGDRLVVGLNSDASVRRLGKGSDRPVHGQEHRATLLRALRCVDAVVIFDEDTPLSLIQSLRPSVLVKEAIMMPHAPTRKTPNTWSAVWRSKDGAVARLQCRWFPGRARRQRWNASAILEHENA